MLLGFLIGGLPQILLAQEQSRSSLETKEKPVWSATPLSSSSKILIDGKLSEPIWSEAEVATNFLQRMPHTGHPASERTEAYLLYGDDALYVGAHLYDTAPDSIASDLFRKDGGNYSDWFTVLIDSYFDRRTAFAFGVNPAGVRRDFLMYNDTDEDMSWEAVWEADAQLVDDGWVVELRIPLSQLRYKADQEESQWGVNLQRVVARNDEMSFWAHTPPQAGGLVSEFGILDKLKNLQQPKRLEVIPYVSGKLDHFDGTNADPYYQAWDPTAKIGADIKYGISSDFTLTATLNPDFGQVEVDPAVVNLSAYETYYAEKRPFFLEGVDIFNFGGSRTFNTSYRPNIFYSRRIGRSPQGSIQADDVEYTDRPQFTTIAGAAKVSGKTSDGWSIGMLNAVTLQEKASFTTEPGTSGKQIIEPATNYFVGRIRKDINSGETVVGGYVSAVNRNLNTAYLQDLLHEQAYTAGVDFERSWKDRSWIFSSVLVGSAVKGSPEVIQETQESSRRYYQRPDADYLAVETNATTLSGLFNETSLRYQNEHWLGSVTYSTTSPGFEVNDMGFQGHSDRHTASTFGLYRQNTPQGIFQQYEIFGFTNQAWNYGGDIIQNSYSMGGYWQLKNFWNGNVFIRRTGKQKLDRLTRGGPLAARSPDVDVEFRVGSDPRKNVTVNTGYYHRQDASGEYDHNIWLDFVIKPNPSMKLTLSPSYNSQLDTDQYVDAIEDPLATHTYGTRYIFADIQQRTLSTSIRMDWTFTPNMSLQLYARPFITAGDFRHYKEFSTPGEYNFDVYGEDQGTIQNISDSYLIDPDGDRPASNFEIDEQDFNFRSLRGNAVLRWEYKPGSVLFLVWQQTRNEFSEMHNLVPNRDYAEMLRAPVNNTFLVKFTYWFSS
ncbi:MAG: DUF5916 domain-containing protein [Bacteroidota bacterium]